MAMLLVEAFGDADCCSYIDGPASACGARVKYGSPYCRTHHAVCYIPEGSQREARKLEEFADEARRGVIVAGGEIITGLAARDVWARHQHILSNGRFRVSRP